MSYCSLTADPLANWLSVLSLFSSDLHVIEITESALQANTIMFFTFGFQFTYSTLYMSLGKAMVGGILNISR